MAAVFDSKAELNIVKAHEAEINVSGNPIIAIDVTIQFQRPVESVPVLGKKNVVSVGRPSGTFTANAILCKDDKTLEALKLTGNDCQPFSMDISLAGTCDMGSSKITCAGCVASAVNIQAQGGRGYIVRGGTVTFTQLDIN